MAEFVACGMPVSSASWFWLKPCRSWMMRTDSPTDGRSASSLRGTGSSTVPSLVWSSKDFAWRHRVPMQAAELEEFEALSALPLRQDDGPRVVVPGNSFQAGNVICCRPRSSAALCLNEHDLKQIPAFEPDAVTTMVLSNCDQVHNATGFGLRRTAEVDQVPLGSSAPGVCDKPLRHRSGPLRRVLSLPPWSHFVGWARHGLRT